MTDQFKTKKMRVDRLTLSPHLPAEYRRMLLGLMYRASMFSQLPQQLLIDYVMTHPPVGTLGADGQFYVTSNVRSLAIKSHLPADTRILVLIDTGTQRTDLEFIAAQRELLNCIVPAMKGDSYEYTLVALWDVVIRGVSGLAPLVPTQTDLAKLAGVRRQSLSEKRSSRVGAEFMSLGGHQND
jgi:hypothetical protein